MFSFRQIHFGYDHLMLLQNAELDFAPGQLTLLRGANGAGKTTLLKILAGLLRPQQCQITLASHSDSWQKMRKLIRRQSCYLHQSPYMFNGDVIHNVKIFNKTKSTTQLMSALRLVGIEHLADQQAKTLSGGERQRLAMARAFLYQPKVLLLDEPLSNMDTTMVERTLLIIDNFKKLGCSVILCSHLHETLHDISDQHLTLKNGQIYQQ